MITLASSKNGLRSGGTAIGSSIYPMSKPGADAFATGMATQQQVANALGVSLATIRRLRARRQLAWHRVGGQVRISISDVQLCLSRARTASTGDVR